MKRSEKVNEEESCEETLHKRIINKRLLATLNQVSIGITGGLNLSQTNIRQGQNLGFIETIHINSFFGQVIYESLHHQAAAYMFNVIKNHTFNDGNKRTGLLAAVCFLKWNGVHLKPFDQDRAYDFVIEVAAGPNDPDTVIPKIAEWFKSMEI